MEHKKLQARKLPLLHAGLIATGLFSLLLFFGGLWSSTAKAAEEPGLAVFVDGRVVTIESVEAQLKGATSTYTEVLAFLGSAAVRADSVEVFAPPDSPIDVADVKAVIEGRKITLVNLSRPLAARGRIGVWLNGATWRICIIITWDSKANLDVTVDDRVVTVEDTVTELDGRRVPLRDVLASFGGAPAEANKIEIFNPANPSATQVLTEGVKAVVNGNTLAISGLSSELAARGRIGIWVSGSNWRICVVISWGSKANLDVSVDGRQAQVEGIQAEVAGEAADLYRVLALIGDEEVIAEKVEWFDPANPANTKVLADAKATLRGGQLNLTGVAPELAARGKIGIWVSTSKWRICVVIIWGSKANLDVKVDGRQAQVEGIQAEVAGEAADLYRVLALIGDEEVMAEKVEWFDPANPANTKVLADAKATLRGGQLNLTGVAPELAARGKIGIWVSTSKWRICVVISWGSKANLDVSVDGRQAQVEGIQAEVAGEAADLYRVLALIGDEEVIAEKVEWFDPANPANTKVLADAKATLRGGQLNLTGVAPELAARGKIGIWVSTSKWRICVVIIWGSKANLDVNVDGRQAQVEGIQAEVAGEAADLYRVLALIGDEEVMAEKVEWFDPANEANTKVLADAKATLRGGQLNLTGVAPELAARGKIGIWVSTSKWRICVVIIWGSKANLDVNVDGRQAQVEGIQAEVAGEAADLYRVLALIGDEEVVAEKVEWFDPANEANTKVLADAKATLRGGQLNLTGVAPELAARGKIGIWVSTSKWRICVVIIWGSKANLDVNVDGRDIKVESVAAEIDGEATELRRVLELLGSATVAVDKIEIFKPALAAAGLLTDPITITPTQQVSATVSGNLVRFEGLANTLALHKRIGIWISGSRWRICIIITLGSDNTPRVIVDGRPVLAYQPAAEFDGETVDPRRVLAFLSEQAVTADKVEIEADGQPLTDTDATAQIKEGQIIFTNLADTLAAKGRISVWISGARWRICVTIEWGIHRSPDGKVNVDLPASNAHNGLKIDYTKVTTPTNALPERKRSVVIFTLDAMNSAGSKVQQLDESYKIEVSYTDEELAAAGIDEATLKLYVFDEETGAWVAIPTAVDVENNKAVGTLDHFSEFALLGEARGSTVLELFLPLIQR